MKNKKLYWPSDAVRQGDGKPLRLHDMQMDPRGFRVSPRQAAAIRRAQLDAIREREQGYSMAERTLRRAYLYKASLPHVHLRAAERRAQLDKLAERAEEYGHPDLKGR